MMVTFVSQCQKQALNRSRRVLDAFANRIGDNTWQTIISQEGLQAVRKLLRQSASKNTAVSCHWMRSRAHSELLWVVGNRQRFNHQGRVPVNRTHNMQLQTERDDNWHTGEVISLLSGIAGLFHDVGKANVSFQKKLIGKSKRHPRFEPYRHEWVSLRLFEAFIATSGQCDKDWLKKLAAITPKDEAMILKKLKKDDRFAEEEEEDEEKKQSRQKSPFHADGLPADAKIAKTVAWLILSHHRLPKFHPSKQRDREPGLKYADKWLSDSLHWHWNALNAEADKFKKSSNDFKNNWLFNKGTPLCSKTWCDKAHQLAKRALNHPTLFTTDWLSDAFTSHLARLSLMLSDHVYSAGKAKPKWQDSDYQCIANTEQVPEQDSDYQCVANTDKAHQPKQKLDEHNIGVAHNAYFLPRELSTLKRNLPSLGRMKHLESHTNIARFKWQNQAYQLASSLKKTVKQHGFFGVNMASTGCGKTLANVRIMYALADDVLGARMAIALGLRTLTLQTGEALRRLLTLSSDDIATLIGSQAVKRLYDDHHQTARRSESTDGSESATSLIDDYQAIYYEGQLYDGQLGDGSLRKWLKRDSRLMRLISAPIVVSTIDHLIPATEGERGGKQIAPMLRLLTADLILDEPDDFGIDDLPALSRLVNWAGMLGSKVLLSSATLPPSIIDALFDAYLAGRRHFDKACGEPRTSAIHCAWFDETTKPQYRTIAQLETFQQHHQAFVAKRCQQLAKQGVKRVGELLTITPPSAQKQDVIKAMGASVAEAINTLHHRYHDHDAHRSKTVSVGLVRIANINPLVALAKQVIEQPVKADHHLHFCIYHSQHPLIVRSHIEHILDTTLKRDDDTLLWQKPAIKEAIADHPEAHHIFVVFATAVAEVGRDHDYDWAIVEPSSMRSIIQLAGRVWRHRDKTCDKDKPNMLIMNKNYCALTGDKFAYHRPGFESEKFPLTTHDMNDLLKPHNLSAISALPRIQPEGNTTSDGNLIALEHAHMQETLYGKLGKEKKFAANWWQQPVHWSAEMQRHTPFRKSPADTRLIFLLNDEDDDVAPYTDGEDGYEPKKSEIQCIEQTVTANGISAWPANLSIKPLLRALIEKQSPTWKASDERYNAEALTEEQVLTWCRASKTYTEIRISKKINFSDYCYEVNFGLYKPYME